MNSTEDIGRGGRRLKEMGSFRVKLVVYFVLLAFVPLAAAFWGFRSIAARSETRQADARLQSGLRAAVAAYDTQLASAQARAGAFAHRADVARALARHDRTALASLLPEGLRVVAPRLRVGESPRAPAAERSVAVYDQNGLLGRVVASVALDVTLAKQLALRSGLAGGDRVAFVYAPAPVQPQTISAGGVRYRAVPAPALEG